MSMSLFLTAACQVTVRSLKCTPVLWLISQSSSKSPFFVIPRTSHRLSRMPFSSRRGILTLSHSSCLIRFISSNTMPFSNHAGYNKAIIVATRIGSATLFTGLLLAYAIACQDSHFSSYAVL